MGDVTEIMAESLAVGGRVSKNETCYDAGSSYSSQSQTGWYPIVL